MHRLVGVIVIVILAGWIELDAQSFSSVNGRNHPELNWISAETEHFQIIYPSRLAGIETHAASIAEATYDSLASFLSISPRKKIRIYLSDEDEIANGFAVPIGMYTCIWVHSNSYAESWTGNIKWLRKVLAHELAHLFHYETIRSNRLGFLASNLFGRPVPSFWTEGIAQFLTETWDSERGDRWLRTAVLDDRLSYSNPDSRVNGRLKYAVGHAQLRFLGQEYGDSTLVQILKHRKRVLGGTADVHDFYTAFEDVTGISYPEFYDSWRRYTNVYYNSLAGRSDSPDSLTRVSPKLPFRYIDDIKISPQDSSHWAVLTSTTSEPRFQRLVLLNRHEGNKIRILTEASIRGPLAWSPEGTSLAYAMPVRGQNGSILFDIFETTTEGITKRITMGRRASKPAYSPDGTAIAFVSSSGESDNIYLYDRENGSVDPLTDFSGDVQINSMQWRPGSSEIAYARFEPDGTRSVVLLDTHSGMEQLLFHGIEDFRVSAWNPAGTHLALTSLGSGAAEARIMHLESSDTLQVPSDLITGLSVLDWTVPDSLNPAGRLLALSLVETSGEEIFWVDASRSVTDRNSGAPEAYRRWTNYTPSVALPDFVEPSNELVLKRKPYRSIENLGHLVSFVLPYFGGRDDWGFAGTSVWRDPLDKHQFGLAAYANLARFSGSQFVFQYVNRMLYPTLSFSAFRVPLPADGIHGRRFVWEDQKGFSLSASSPVDRFSKTFSSAWLSVSTGYRSRRPLTPADGFAPVQGLQSPVNLTEIPFSAVFTWKQKIPTSSLFRYPRKSTALRVRLSGALDDGENPYRHVNIDLASYVTRSLPLSGQLYLYGRLQSEWGTSVPQDRIGWAEADFISVGFNSPVPDAPDLVLGSRNRIRGYRDSVVGKTQFFGTAAYRFPIIIDLNTSILGGLFTIRRVSFGAFTDIGWMPESSGSARDFRAGSGFEVANQITVAGIPLVHSAGWARPHSSSQHLDDEWYYRIQAVLPF